MKTKPKASKTHRQPNETQTNTLRKPHGAPQNEQLCLSWSVGRSSSSGTFHQFQLSVIFRVGWRVWWCCWFVFLGGLSLGSCFLGFLIFEDLDPVYGLVPESRGKNRKRKPAAGNPSKTPRKKSIETSNKTWLAVGPLLKVKLLVV